MKHLLLSFLLLSIFDTEAQDLAGRKIVNAHVSFNYISDKQGNEFTTLSSSVLYGKIKPDLSYWSYGAVVGIYPGTDQHNVSFGPAVEHGKFIKLIDKLYLSPYFGGSLQGQFGADQGILLNAYVSPLRFMYHFKENFLLSANFGSASFQTRALNSSTLISLNASLENNSSFGVFYTFK